MIDLVLFSSLRSLTPNSVEPWRDLDPPNIHYANTPIAAIYNGMKALGYSVQIYIFEWMMPRGVPIPEARAYGISYYFFEEAVVENLSTKLKAWRPESIVFVGGAHATTDPLRALKLRGVDYVCRGDGFNTLSQVFESWDWDNNPYIASTRKPVASIAPFPTNMTPSNIILDPSAYVDATVANELLHSSVIDEGVIASGAGCQFECAFCSNSKVYGSDIRFRHSDRVANDIIDLIQFPSIRAIKMSDSNTTPIGNTLSTAYMEYLDSIFYKVARSGKFDIEKHFFSIFIKPAGVTQAYLDLISSYNGFLKFRLMPGIDSLDERILKVMRKGETVESILSLFDRLRFVPNVISVFGCMIIGVPGETDATISAYISRWQEIQRMYKGTGKEVLGEAAALMILPNSYFYEHAEEYPDHIDLSLPIDWYPTREYVNIGLKPEWFDLTCDRIERYHAETHMKD